MKNKPIIIITAFLLIISAACAGLGYYQKMQKDNQNNNNKKEEEKITYEYYVDDIIQESIPTNNSTPTIDDEGETVTNEYVFTRYQCDNNVTGNFDTDKWEFVPDQVKNATCRIYFAKSFYNVALTVSNGVYEGENPTRVQREQDASLSITPSEGYEFKDISCANSKTANYDISTNTLNISSIMEDVACRVNFEIKQLKMVVNVKNGKENTTETVNYGESVSAVVQPNNGYENPKIECTNSQKATFKDNKILIEKLTNNTTCTVTFVKVKPKTYKLTITLPTNNKATITNDNGEEVETNIVTITNGSTETTYEEGKDASFSLKTLDGYTSKIDCGGVYPSKELKDEADKNITNYTFLEISKDITCKVTATKNE